MVARRMDRVWIAGGVVVAVALAAVAWLFFLSPQLDSKAATEQQVADTQMQNLLLHNKISQLRAERAHAGELRQQVDVLQAGLPVQHDLDSFTDQVAEHAKAAHVTVASITPGAPTKIAAPKGKSPSASDAKAGNNPVEKAESVAGDAADRAAKTDADASGKGSTSKGTQGPAGQLYSIAVALVTDGSMDEQRDFLSLLEKAGPRRALVVSAAFTPAPVSDGGDAAQAAPTTKQWVLTTQLQIFVAPQTPKQEAALAEQLGAAN